MPPVESTTTDRLLISRRELARQLGVGETTVKKLIREGRLPLKRYRLCRKWLFCHKELEQWVSAGMPPASRWSFLREQAAGIGRRATG